METAEIAGSTDPERGELFLLFDNEKRRPRLWWHTYKHCILLFILLNAAVRQNTFILARTTVFRGARTHKRNSWFFRTTLIIFIARFQFDYFNDETIMIVNWVSAWRQWRSKGVVREGNEKTKVKLDPYSANQYTKIWFYYFSLIMFNFRFVTCKFVENFLLK